jgi:hypothetical protein
VKDGPPSARARARARALAETRTLRRAFACTARATPARAASPPARPPPPDATWLPSILHPPPLAGVAQGLPLPAVKRALAPVRCVEPMLRLSTAALARVWAECESDAEIAVALGAPPRARAAALPGPARARRAVLTSRPDSHISARRAPRPPLACLPPGISRLDYDHSARGGGGGGGGGGTANSSPRASLSSDCYDPRPWTAPLRTTLCVVLASRSCREGAAWRRANRAAVREAEKRFVDPNPFGSGSD